MVTQEDIKVHYILYPSDLDKINENEREGLLKRVTQKIAYASVLSRQYYANDNNVFVFPKWILADFKEDSHNKLSASIIHELIHIYANTSEESLTHSCITYLFGHKYASDLWIDYDLVKVIEKSTIELEEETETEKLILVKDFSKNERIKVGA